MKISHKEFKNWDDNRYRGRFFNALSGYKSAILVGTCDDRKNTNLAIFSSLFHLGADPALMGFVVRPDVSPRHTLLNIEKLGSYTLNHVPYGFHQKAHHTSARFPEDVSEFKACGLNEEWHEGFSAPFVKEALVKWSMTFIRRVDIEENGTHIIIGQVKDIFVPDECLQKDGHLDFSSVDSTVVTGLDQYHQVKKGKRYTYAKPDHSPKILE